MKNLFLTLFLLGAFIFTCQLQASQKPTNSTPEKSQQKSSSGFLKKYNKKIVPIPVFDIHPAEGNTYGLMPILLLSDKESEDIKMMFGLIGQYNETTHLGGAVLAYFFPQAEQEIKFYGELTQDYYRELNIRFFDPHFLKHFYLECEFNFLKTPFGRFYGLGAATAERDESNFTSRNFLLDMTGGYYLLEHLRANFTFRFHTTDLLTRGLNDVADTLTNFNNLPNVVDATNFIYDFSVVYDTRPDFEYSTHGTKLGLSYLFSNKDLGSDFTFHGWNVEAIQLIPIIKNRLTTAARFYFQEVFGWQTPFFELSSLGGENELRSFIPNRFTDHGKMIFQLEERFRLASPKVFGKSFDIYVDPFFELGRVFDASDRLGFSRFQAVGGVGLRAFVPPNVIGRLDIAVGSEGLEIYTELGYPF